MLTRLASRLTLGAILLLVISSFAWADCSLDPSCGVCNSGYFKVHCECHDTPGVFSCNGCQGDGCITSACCCGTRIGNPPTTQCSGASCAGSAHCSKNEHPYGRSTDLLVSTSPEAVLFALNRSGRAQMGGSSIGGRLLRSDFPIETDVDPGSGIELSNIKINTTSDTIKGATFNIKNDTRRSLISYSVILKFYWDLAPDRPLQLSLSEDGWYLNGSVLKSDEQREVNLTASATPLKPMKLLRLVATLEYAQFADGSVFGADPGQLEAKIKTTRKIKLDLQRKYASALRSGTPAKTVADQISSELRNGTTMGPRRVGLVQLVSLLKLVGPQGLADKLLEEPSISLK